MSKVLVFPGSFQPVKNYGGYDGWDIWLKSFPDELPAADYYIGHSGGANFVLARLGSIKRGKFIFINPLIRKRSLLSLFASWIGFFFSEGIRGDIIPVSSWPFGLKRLFEVLKVDAFGTMSKIPKENFIIVRGKNDNYFCDKKSAEILKNNGFKVLEVEAGHDWNKNVAKAVASYIG